MIDLLAHIKGIFDKYKKDEVTVYAAQASFFIVIAFFPFIMLLLTVIQLVPGVQKSDLLSLLVNIMPDMFDPLVVSIINDLYTKSPATIVSITSITALWSAARGMQGIESGLNRVFESPQTKGFILRRIICAGYTLLFIGSCLVSLLLLVFGSTIHGFLTRRFPMDIFPPSEFCFTCGSLMTMWLLSIVFTSLYTYVPVHKHTLRSQVPGGVFATLGWIIFSYLFSIYFNHFSNFSYMYGSLTAIVVVMLWLYICICILLIGAEINYHEARYGSIFGKEEAVTRLPGTASSFLSL